MAEAVISNIVGTITKELAPLIQQRIELACGVEEQLEKLKNTLSAINSVVHAAEEEHDKNEEVRHWLEKLKEAVYDADDVIDEYQTDNVQRQVLVYGSLIKKVCNFCSLSNPMLFRCQLGQKIKKIRESIDEIAKDKSNFHFTVPSVRVGKAVPFQREQTGSDVSSEVIGREADKKAIIKLLLSSNEKENLAIISIVGMGGLGKTTLAQLVFNDDKILSHFGNRKIWMSVSDDFNVRQISQRIAEKLDYTSYGHLDFDLLQKLLKQSMSTGKYLLVLDDVWNNDRVKWSRLRDLLMNGAGGSKVLVTTRDKTIASMMATDTSYVYNLSGLPDDKCLNLFLSWAFHRFQEPPQNLVAIGKEIVGKCGGLPLAARTLGCFLYGKDEGEWLSVKTSEIWELNQKEDDVLPVLRLTYDHLPQYLKPCFAFCSLFPKQHLIDKETLIHLWMAQGFLQSSDGSPPEKIGNRYVNELLSTSLLEDELKDHDDEARHCKMHDLTHDLAQLVAGTECSIITERSIVPPNSKISTEKVRHVSVSGSGFSSKMKVKISECLCNAKKMRTLYSHLLVEQKETVINLLANLKFLRILILSESEFDGLPSSIGSLVHLRYLDLSMNRRITKLPNSICKLQNLQTLKLYACVKLDELPKDTWKIATLRHLDITSKQVFLPKNGIESLTSLRSLSIHNCYRLRTLVRGMQHWTAIQKLRLTDCPSLYSLEFGLNSLISLEILEIRNCSVLDLREQIVDEEIKEEGRQGLPELREDGLQRRWSLPSLLNIVGLNYRKEHQREENEDEEKKEEGNQGLQKLRSLTFVQLPRLIELPKELKNAASSLHYLSISNCENLFSLPDWLPQCTALKKLEIKRCPTLLSSPGSKDGSYTIISPSQDELKELVTKTKKEKALKKQIRLRLNDLSEERSNLDEF